MIFDQVLKEAKRLRYEKTQSYLQAKERRAEDFRQSLLIPLKTSSKESKIYYRDIDSYMIEITNLDNFPLDLNKFRMFLEANINLTSLTQTAEMFGVGIATLQAWRTHTSASDFRPSSLTKIKAVCGSLVI